MGKPVEDKSRVVFDDLIVSSIKWFNRAIDTFESDKEIDASIVYFAISQELILKSILALEHWALLIDDPRLVPYSSFVDGSARSITYANAIERIQSLKPHVLKKDGIIAFQGVVTHRNQIVHYTHRGLIDKKKCEKIKISILKAWYYLHLLIESEISPHLNVDQKKQTQLLYKRMEKINGFWHAVFLTKNNIFEEMKKGGKIVFDCFRCKQQSLIRKSSPHGVYSQVTEKCLVCNYFGAAIYVNCPKCKYSYNFQSYNAVCPECSTKLFKKMKPYNISYDEFFNQPVYCSNCCSEDVYRMEDDLFICGSCFTYKTQVSTCEYCDSTFMGDIGEDSFIEGCELCDGKRGEWESKDD